MPDENGKWTPLEEQVALALINQSLPDQQFGMVDDVPCPRLRSEIPYAIAALAVARPIIAAEERAKLYDELIALSDKNKAMSGGGIDYLANNAQWTRVTYWLRNLKDAE
jgi:hypothetical protein